MDSLSLKFILSTSLNLITSFLCVERKRLGIYWLLGIYIMVYFIGFMFTFVLNHFSSNKSVKSYKKIFFDMISILELLLFLIFECSILNEENNIIQKISDLNRMTFLVFRSFVVNKLLCFKLKKTGGLFFIYVCYILLSFFFYEKNNQLKNLVIIILGFTSIFLLSIFDRTDKKIKCLNIFKQLFKSFFLIKNGKHNKIMNIQGEFLKKFLKQKRGKSKKNLKNSDLNGLFLVEKSFLYLNSSLKSSILNFNEDEFVKCELDHLINNFLLFEKEEEVSFKVKIIVDISKTFILLIRKLNIDEKTYILFALSTDSELKEKKELKEASKNKEFFYFLKKLKKLLSNSRKLVENVIFNDNLKDEIIFPLKIIWSKLLFNILKIDNLTENEFPTTLTVSKINISLFAEEIIEVISPIAQSKNILFTFSMDDHLRKIKIKLDFQKLRQILLNLFFYSIKISKENSKIEFLISFIDENIKKLKFSIHNTGIKMTSETLAELNSVFLIPKDQNYEYKTPKNYEALMASQNLVNSFGGSRKGIKITADIENGSTFEFLVDIKKIYFESNLDYQKLQKSSLLSFSKLNSIKSYPKTQKSKSRFSLIEVKSNNSFKNDENENGQKNNIRFTSLNNSAAFSSRKTNIISNASFLKIQMKSRLEPNCDCRQILIIDNNIFKIKLFTTVFMPLNLKCLVAENEEKSMKILSSPNNCTDPNCQGIQIIFIDLFASISNCTPLIKKIKGIYALKEISENAVPILGTVSMISKEQIDECIDSGLNDFIPNPLNKKTILNSLMKWTNLLNK